MLAPVHLLLVLLRIYDLWTALNAGLAPKISRAVARMRQEDVVRLSQEDVVRLMLGLRPWYPPRMAIARRCGGRSR